MATVNDLMLAIANEIDQSATAPTTGGTDWTIRLNLINRSLKDWAETYDWDELKKIFNGVISTSTGNASLALPGDFRKLDGFPKVGEYDYLNVDPSRNGRYSSSDKYVNILGSPMSGPVMFIGTDTLASGTSVQFTYWASPASLSTISQVAEIPDSTYLVQRTLYYLYKGREDGRFPEAKAESDKILARMIENQNTRGLSSADRRVSVGGEYFPNFRIGRD